MTWLIPDVVEFSGVSATLEAVTHVPLLDDPVGLDEVQPEAIAQIVGQAKDAGIAAAGPDGLLTALTAHIRRGCLGMRN